MQIAPHLRDIIELIAKNETVSVIAPTGSGKSLALPAYIAGTGARCFVTVPTRTAAISLYEIQKASQAASDPTINNNNIIGYAAEGNVNYTKETKIAYVTGGHARRKMLSYFSQGKVSDMTFCDVLMVDEIHSGSIDTTIILALWRSGYLAGVKVPRLVIATATPVPVNIEPKPVVFTVNVNSYPIAYNYLREKIEIDDVNKLHQETAQLGYNIHNNSDIDSGHILIFVAGSSDVESVSNNLNKLLVENGSNKLVDVIPAFSALKIEDINKIYETNGDTRKIIVATNIAEMSITIQDIGHVIDTLLEKRAETSQSGGFRLTTHYISKDSAKQRAGRTGRTRSGICHRMCTQEFFEQLPQHRPPEIQRIPIYEVVMELLNVGLSPAVILPEINSQRLTNSINLLNNLDMIKQNGSLLIVTDIGKFAPLFPLSVRNSVFLWNWIQSNYPIFPGLVVSCLIDCYGPSYFWMPRRDTSTTPADYNIFLRNYKEKNFAKFVGANDLESCINMWNSFTSYFNGITPNYKQLSSWCHDNSLNNKKIKELLTIITQSLNTLNRLNYSIVVGPFTTAGVMKAARPLLLSVYKNNIFYHSHKLNYLNPITKESYILDSRDSVSTLSNNPPLALVGLVTAEIQSQHNVLRIISFSFETDVDSSGNEITHHSNQSAKNIYHHPTAPKIPQSAIGSQKIQHGLSLLSQLASRNPSNPSIANPPSTTLKQPPLKPSSTTLKPPSITLKQLPMNPLSNTLKQPSQKPIVVPDNKSPTLPPPQLNVSDATQLSPHSHINKNTKQSTPKKASTREGSIKHSKRNTHQSIPNNPPINYVALPNNIFQPSVILSDESLSNVMSLPDDSSLGEINSSTNISPYNIGASSLDYLNNFTY